MKRRIRAILALLLAVLMMVGIFPVSALANEGTGDFGPDSMSDQKQPGLGPDGKAAEHAPAPNGDDDDDGFDDDNGPGSLDDASAGGTVFWRAEIRSGRLVLKFGENEEYTLKSMNKVFPDNAVIRARFWEEGEEARYRAELGELNATENRVLGLSLRDDKDEVYSFGDLVEFYLTCEDWKGKTLDELNDRYLSLYLTTKDGDLGAAQILFQIMDGAPAMFFSANLLADLLLNEPNEAELEKRREEAREAAEKAAALAQEEQEKKNAEVDEDTNYDDDAVNNDENKDLNKTDNDLENKDKPAEDKKGEDKETGEEKEGSKEEKPEEQKTINYVPQVKSLGETTVTAKVPEGSLNEYAQLTLTPLSDDLTNSIRALILNKVNPEEEQGADSEAAGDDGQVSVAKKQEIASIVLLDVGFVAGDTNHFPTQPVILTIQSDEIKGMTAPRLYHYANGEVEDLTDEETTDINTEAGAVTFNAASFSPFAVVDLEDEGTVKTEVQEASQIAEKVDAEDAVDVSDHPLAEVGASDYEPLLSWEQLSPRTQALLGMETQKYTPPTAKRGMLKAAPRMRSGSGDGDVPTEGPVTVDGMTIERVSVKWLSKSTGEEEPAGYNTLELSSDSSTVGNQQFQLDFALSGKDNHEPGTIEIIFPAYLWLDRNGNEPGYLTLSVPEEPETGADFAWRRVGDNIVITNTRRISQAAKVMIQGTFRDVKAPDMVDIDVAQGSDYADAANPGHSNPFYVTIGITTPNDEYAALRSNTIDATIDTHVVAASATKSAFNTSTREYYVYHKVGDRNTEESAMYSAGGNMPEEFLEVLTDQGLDPDDFSYARWYVSGSMTGSQPALMTVNETYNGEVVHYLDALHQETEILDVEGYILGVQGALVKDESTGTYSTGNVASEDDGETVSAVLYDGYNTLPKSAYVWTAYKKADFPTEGDEYRIANSQTTEVTGWDDQITTTKEASAEAPFRLPVQYTAKKVWNDAGHEARRPEHQSFLVYYNEDLHTLEKIRVSEANEWTYTWDDGGHGRQYKLRELGMSSGGYDGGREEKDATTAWDEYLKDGVDNSYSYNYPNFMQKGNAEYSHIINRIYDEDGDLQEYDRWWYSLEKEEYDSETHTWTEYNKYNEEHVVRTLVPFKEQKLEVGISKTRLDHGNNSLMSTSDRDLNVLRRGNDAVVSYNVYGYGYIIDLTKEVEIENLSITDFGFRDVKLELEDNYGTDTMKDVDNTFLFDSSLKLTPDDVEVAYVNLSTPTYLHYYQPDKYSAWTFRSLTAQDFANFERPQEELWGCDYSGNWTKYAVMAINQAGTASVTAVAGTGATVSGSRVNLPSGVWKVKTEMVIPGLNNPDMTEQEAQEYLKSRIDGVRMSYSIGVRLLATSETLQDRLAALFDANDYVMCTLDNYATINVYEQDAEGTGFHAKTSLDDQSRTWLHGRNHKSAVRQEKSFEMIENDQVKRELKLHTKVNMTQQSNILEQAEYWDARAEGLIPSTESGTWYDLLPLGILPDVDSVTLTSGDRITDVYTIENYKDSGRVMLVVKADVEPHVSYTNSWDPNPYKNDITYPKEGYKDVHTLEFDAYYAWDEARLYGIDNVRNVAAYEADEDTLGNINGWAGEPDDPEKNHNQRAMDAVGADSDLMTNLDPTRPEGHSAFVYSGAVMKHDEIDFMAETELRKYVTKDGLGVWTTGRAGRTQVTVHEGDYYTYMLYVASANETTTTNIILLDSLETYVPDADDQDDYGRGRWQGLFDSVDVSGLEELGIAPVVYYNTSDVNLYELKGESTSTTTEIEDPNLVFNYLQNPANGWTTVLPTDPSTVRAIAVDLRYTEEGTPFELEEDQNLFCTVRMRARIYDTSGEATDPFNSDETARQQAENNDYAFNNIFLGCTQIDPVGRQTHAIINFNYVRVGILPFELKVTKVWDDANNNDGLRPNSIVVHLLANGQRMNPDKSVTLNNANNWSDGFDHVIQYDEAGNWITYTFAEESGDSAFSLDGYTQSIERQGQSITLTNKHIPEKTSLPFTKEWHDDDTEDNRQYRPDSVTVRLLADGVFSGKTIIVKPDRNGNWAGNFTDLPKYANPEGLSGRQHEIVYTVEEEPVYKYNSDVEVDPETGGITINNRFYPYGNLQVQKIVNNATEVSKDQEFTFTLLLKDSEGNDLTEKYGAFKSSAPDTLLTVGNGDTFTLHDGEMLKIVDIPSECTYEVIESDTPGFTLVSSSGSAGVIRAGSTIAANFTNRYSAAGSQSVSLFKTLEGRDMTRYQFRFELVDKNPGSETEGEAIRTASADADGNAMFSRLSYTEADHGKTFTYEIHEVDREKPGYTYDANIYTVKVTVTDNGDGTMTCTPKYYKADGTEVPNPADPENGVVFRNEYHASGSIALKAWKQLPDGALADYGPFEFQLIGEVPVTSTSTGDGGETGGDQAAETTYKFDVLQTKESNETGTVTFDVLNFTEKDVGKTFLYVIKEKEGTDERVKYADTLRGIELSVADNGNGTLAITQTNVTVTETTDIEGNTTYIKGGETTELPIFVNHLVPGDLSVTKLTNWDDKEPDATELFPFRLTLVGNEEAGIVIPETVTVLLTAVENTKPYEEEGNVIPEPSYTDQIPGVQQVATEGGVKYQIAVDSDGGFNFGLYAGQKLTIVDLPSGLAYQFQESIPSGWTLEFENVAGVVVPAVTTAATYTNTYEPGKAVATVIATKKLDGKAPEAKKFAFELIDDNEVPDTVNVPQTLWNHASGYVLFDLEYDEPGTYHYKIREVQKLIDSVSDDGVITYVTDEDELRKIEFDENEYPVTIVVEKIIAEDGSETLTAKVYYAAEAPQSEGGEGSGTGQEIGSEGNGTASTGESTGSNTPPQFQNKTRPGSLQITKVGEGLTEANKDAEFKFKVVLSNDAGMPLTENGSMFWYAEESEETVTPEPAPETPDQPENSEPAADEPQVQLQAAPGRTLKAVRQQLMGAATNSSLRAVGDENEGSGKYAGGIAPTTTEVLKTGTFSGSGAVVNGVTQGAVIWTVYKDGTCIIEPKNGVSGSFSNTGNTSPIDSTTMRTITRVRVLGTCYAVGNAGHIFDLNSSNSCKVQYADLRGMDVSRCTSLYELFDYCQSLSYVDISTWHNIPNSCDMTMWLWYSTQNQLSIIKLPAEVRFKNFSSQSHWGSNTRWYALEGTYSGQLTSDQLVNLYKNGNGVDATWVKVGYNPNFMIAFNPNGATGSMDSITASLANPPTLPACTFESDLNFMGWSTDPNAILPEYADRAVFTGAAMGGQTVTLYALWMSEDSFLLHYNGNGGYSRTQWQRVNGPTDSVTMPVATHPSNYEFLYWSTGEDGSGSRFSGMVSGADFNADPGSTIELYAQFLDPSRRAQIVVEHYQQNTDLSSYSLAQTDRLGAFDLESEVAISNSREFRGFVTPSVFKVLSGTSTTEVEQADGTTVTVVQGGVTVRYYYDRTHYKLAFDANGGEGSMAEMEMTGGIPAKLPVNRFTKENAIFVGWNTEQDGSGTNYGDGQSVNSIAGNNQTLTLYAQWFNTDDAQEAEATNGEYTVTCKANETIVFPSLPAGTHYEITEIELPEGWTLSGIENGSGTILSAERVNVTATNTYNASGVVDLLAHKSLPGESINEGQFSFQLLDESGTVLQTISNSNVDSMEQALDDEGNPIPNVYFGTAPVYFDSIYYNSQGVYHYTIKEVAGSDSSIRYDEHVEHVTVAVTDQGDGRLSTQVLYDQSGANFRNTMSNGDLKVSKTVRNATELSADKNFIFTLYLFDSSGNEITEEYPVTMPDGSKTTVSSGGTVTIKGGESFLVTGLPHHSTYIVVESPADGFELVGKSNDEGTIQAGETQEAAFENAYSSKTDVDGGTGAVIEAKKVFEGGKIEAEQFQFRLMDSDENVLETVFAGTDGKVEFSALHYTLADDRKTYTYFIEEVPGVVTAGDESDSDTSEGEDAETDEDEQQETIVADPNIIYDTHRERVMVSVSDNGDGTMTARVQYSGETEEESLQPPVYTNEMKKGNLKIIKTLEKFESSEPATFVFDIKAVAGQDDEGNEIVVYTNVVSMTFTEPDTQSTLVTGIPIGATVTVEEVYSGARYTGTVVKDTATILAPDEGTAEVEFSNTYDGTGTGGHGILNSFTAQQGEDGYSWGGWEKPDMNNPEQDG